MSALQRQLLLYLVVLPCALAVLAGWQVSRGHGRVADLVELDTLLTQNIAEVAAMPKNRYDLSVEIQGKRYAPALALDKLQDLQGSVGTALVIQRGATVLAWSGVWTALAALLLSGLALAALQWASRAAMTSRQRLLRLFEAGRRLLPLVLLGQIALLTLAVVCVGSFEALGLWHVGRMGAGEIKLQIIAALLIFGLLASAVQLLGNTKRMYQAFEVQPMNLWGRLLSREDGAGLWQTVEDLAQRLGALMPEQIVVGIQGGFFVTSGQISLQPENRIVEGRTLYIPLPWLTVMNRDESRAIISHELAHFSGEDTAYSLRFVPIYGGVTRALELIGEHSGGLMDRFSVYPALLLGHYFLRQFDHSVGHWSRIRELEADRASGQTVGSQIAAAALVRTVAVQPGLDAQLETLLDRAESVPEDLLAALMAGLEQQGLSDPLAHLADRQFHPSDSHPPTVARIEAFGVAPDDAVRGEGARPVVAARDLAALHQYLYDPAALSRTLSVDLKTGLGEHEQAVHQFLTEQAAGVQDVSTLYAVTRVRGWVLIGLGVLLCALGAFLVHMLMAWQIKKAGALIAGCLLFVLALAGLMFFAGRMFLRRDGKPVLTLSPDSLRFDNSLAPLPSHHVVGHQIVHHQVFALVLWLEPDAPLPALRTTALGRRLRRFTSHAHVFRERGGEQRVEVHFHGLRGEQGRVKLKELDELVTRYLEAGHARRALAEHYTQGATPDAAQATTH